MILQPSFVLRVGSQIPFIKRIIWVQDLPFNQLWVPLNNLTLNSLSTLQEMSNQFFVITYLHDNGLHILFKGIIPVSFANQIFVMKNHIGQLPIGQGLLQKFDPYYSIGYVSHHSIISLCVVSIFVVIKTVLNFIDLSLMMIEYRGISRLLL